MIFRKKKPQKRVKTNKRPKTVPAKPSPKPPVQKPVAPIPDKNENDIFSDKLSNRPPKGKKVDYRKEFLNTFKNLTYRHRAWDIWRDFVIMFACSLSNGLDKSHYEEREARYMKIIGKYNKDEQKFISRISRSYGHGFGRKPGAGLFGRYFYGIESW